MIVPLIYAGNPRITLSTNVDEEATVEDVINASGILNIRSDIDLKRQKVGIYGKFVKLNQAVKSGDRVELYCKITRVLDDDDDDDDDF